MSKNRTDIMVTTGKRKYYYDSKKGMLKIFNLSGLELTEIKTNKESWESSPEWWDKIISNVREHKLTEQERSDLASALHNATDWKEARRAKMKEEKNK